MAGLGTGSNVVVTGSPGTNAEAICATSPLLEVPRDSQTMIIVASAKVTPGTGATSATLRLRRGTTITDPNLFFYTLVGVTPGVGGIFSLNFLDIIASLATVQYSFTYQDVGASGGASINFSSICVWAIL